MTIFLARSRRVKGGKEYNYWTLRANIWTPGKGLRQKYLAALGASKTLTLGQAQAIAKKVNIELADLKRVRGLTILDDEPRSKKKKASKR